MIVVFERSGGVAGMTLRAHVDVDALEPAEQRGLLEDIERAQLSDVMERERPVGRGADRFLYRIKISDAAGTRSWEIADPAPPEVRGLIDRLTRIAKAQRASRRA
jgi:hypothetical protein